MARVACMPTPETADTGFALPVEGGDAGALPVHQPSAPARASWLGGRWRWAGLALLLAVCLLGQIAVQERDRLAAQRPVLIPLLERLCGWLGCELRALQQIESVVIDRSSFVPLAAGAFQLDLALKNLSELPQALPWLELSLMDERQQVLVRKVFTLAHLTVGATVLKSLPPGGQWGGSVQLGLSPAASPPAASTASDASAGVAGYQLRIFYP